MPFPADGSLPSPRRSIQMNHTLPRHINRSDRSLAAKTRIAIPGVARRAGPQGLRRSPDTIVAKGIAEVSSEPHDKATYRRSDFTDDFTDEPYCAQTYKSLGSLARSDRRSDSHGSLSAKPFPTGASRLRGRMPPRPFLCACRHGCGNSHTRACTHTKWSLNPF